MSEWVPGVSGLSPGEIAGGIGDVASFAGGLTTPARDDNVLTGTPRDVYDWAFDYSGTWGGQTDQHDIVGPSIDLRGLITGSGTPLIDWRSTQSQEQDPTSPQNMPVPWSWVVGGVVVAAALYLLGPLLEIVANATEGDA